MSLYRQHQRLLTVNGVARHDGNRLAVGDACGSGDWGGPLSASTEGCEFAERTLRRSVLRMDEAFR